MLLLLLLVFTWLCYIDCWCRWCILLQPCTTLNVFFSWIRSMLSLLNGYSGASSMCIMQSAIKMLPVFWVFVRVYHVCVMLNGNKSTTYKISTITSELHEKDTFTICPQKIRSYDEFSRKTVGRRPLLY